MNSFTLCRLASGLLLAALAVSAQAAQVTDTTDMVSGRAPEASDLLIVNRSRPDATPAYADTLEVKYVFTDADGDAEQSSIIQWLVDDVLVSSGLTYFANREGMVRAEISPRSDCEISEPCIGGLVASPSVRIGPIPVGSFYVPMILANTHGDADFMCSSEGARLPTVQELDELFVSAGGGGNKMCDKYGWPQSRICGGETDFYWTSTPNDSGDGFYIYDMNTPYAAAGADLNNNYQFACIR